MTQAGAVTDLTKETDVTNSMQDTAESMQAVIDKDDDFTEATRRLPNDLDSLAGEMQNVIDLGGAFDNVLSDLPDDVDGLRDAMQTVIELADDFTTALTRLPSLEDLNARIDAMRTLIRMAKHDD